MSELSTFNSERIYWAVEQVEQEAGDIDELHLDDNLFYIKSEADKAIAELKDKLRHYPLMVAMLEYDKLESLHYVHKIRHQKYKRCLAMARWCKCKTEAIKNGYIRSSIESQNGVMTTCPPECNPKFSFYTKWNNRWLKIAEKFKETK